jgi:hypothetical protein
MADPDRHGPQPHPRRRVPGQPQHATARPATIRRHLVHIGARIAHSARKIILHLPEQRPWQPAWQQLFTAVHTAPT